ncbi:MAG: ribonucleoside triphosphate reductase [Patescibacteria group bacterium]
MISKVEKRNGEKVDFDKSKIETAVYKALTSSEEGGEAEAKEVSDRVFDLLLRRFSRDEVPQVEQIQDIVEEVLIMEEFHDAAKNYILYREKRREIREMKGELDESSNLVEDYIDEMDWEVKENANMTYSLQGLNQYVTSHVSKEYWLNKIYPENIRKAAKNEDIHIHDLNLLATYCCGWDLQDLLMKGFGGVPSKIESAPPKHLRPALGQIVNFFFTLQGESAGAQAMSNFDTFLAPFIAYDNLSYKQVKQAMQEFLFNCMVPTRVGFQTPFINVSLDIKVPKHLEDQAVIIGGEPQDATYGEFQKEMDMFNRAFYEVIMEGDSKGRVFTFPIPTISITDDFDWDNETLDPMWEATTKYGINYFSNYMNSDMDPEDFRSMCCRLRLDNKELIKRGGGLFGSQPLTGSIGVVTVNMPRIGYLSKTREEFYNRLEKMMDLAKDSLEIKRKVINDFMEKGLYPYSKHYLQGVKQMRGTYYGNHFSTIGLIGMNEACLNFLDKGIGSKEGKEFAEDVLDFMNDKLLEYQEETDNLYNLEATPGEGTAYKQAKRDKEKFPDIITAGTEEVPYYTNSVHLPVNYSDDPIEIIDHQDSLQTKFTGGTVIHLFLGEKISSPDAAKKLIKNVFQNYELPYVSLTPSFSICPNCGYIHGEKYTCPNCKIKKPKKVIKNLN